MRKASGLGLLLAFIAAIVGCEGWDSGSNAFTFDSSFGFANFNGVYRGQGGAIVFDFSLSSSASGGGSLSVDQVSEEIIDTGDGVLTVFSNDLEGKKLTPVIVLGSIIIVAGGTTFTDLDGDGILSAVDGSDGVIDYSTGAWELTFAAPLADGEDITATYSFVPVTSEDDEVGAGPSATIFTFYVHHVGNQLAITDSNGDTYTGVFDSLDFQRASVDLTAATDGPVIGTFTLTGVSLGVSVTIIGILSGDLAGNSLTHRTIQGTWIQADGRTADILGTATDILVPPAGSIEELIIQQVQDGEAELEDLFGNDGLTGSIPLN